MLVKSLAKEYPGTVLLVYDGETCIWNAVPDIDNYGDFVHIMDREVQEYELEILDDEYPDFQIVVEVI